MNLASILTLLQLVLSLLSTPNLPPSIQQQVNSLATQAVSLATQALNDLPPSTQSAQIISPPPTPSTQGFMAITQPTGGVSVPQRPTAVVPTCSLIAAQTQEGINWNSAYPVRVTWTSIDLPPTTKGILYGDIGQSSGVVDYGKFGYLNGPSGTLNHISFGTYFRADFENGTTCSTTLQKEVIK